MFKRMAAQFFHRHGFKAAIIRGFRFDLLELRATRETPTVAAGAAAPGLSWS